MMWKNYVKGEPLSVFVKKTDNDLDIKEWLVVLRLAERGKYEKVYISCPKNSKK